MLVNTYRARLLRLVSLSTGDHDLAETIVQDCFLKAYRARESFRGDCSVSTWLFTIALNVTRDYQRLQKPHFWKSADLTAVKLSDAKSSLTSPEPSPETRLLAEEQADRVQLALKSLSPKQRIVFIMRFIDEMELQEGWKAQNKSVAMFSGEAYNVEMGVSNELFPEERSLPPSSCLFNPTPEDTTNFPASGAAVLSDIVAFSNFIRFLAAPTPSTLGIPGSPSPQSIADGQALFTQVHCNLCHTPALQTGTSSFAAGLSNQSAALYSDLLVHHMGSGLADNVTQGTAGPDEFRTAPLWGLGQRIFFLHDGRATLSNGGLLTAIQEHSGSGSEANGVINLFQQLNNQQQQDLLNFLRSL